MANGALYACKNKLHFRPKTQNSQIRECFKCQKEMTREAWCLSFFRSLRVCELTTSSLFWCSMSYCPGIEVKRNTPLVHTATYIWFRVISMFDISLIPSDTAVHPSFMKQIFSISSIHAILFTPGSHGTY